MVADQREECGTLFRRGGVFKSFLGWRERRGVDAVDGMDGVDRTGGLLRLDMAIDFRVTLFYGRPVLSAGVVQW